MEVDAAAVINAKGKVNQAESKLSPDDEFNKIPFNQLCSLFERINRAKSKNLMGDRLRLLQKTIIDIVECIVFSTVSL